MLQRDEVCWRGRRLDLGRRRDHHTRLAARPVWLRQLEDMSEAEGVAHDDQVLLADAGQTKFQVDVERTDRTTESQLTVSIV